jgi:pimeloyl-ACP methyl ester carboxylesterase
MYADKSAAYDPPYFKQIFPQGYVTALPGTGHFVMMEKPVEFNRMVGAFLRAIKF